MGIEIVSFDDQVGAHGSFGGDQTLPFLIAPRSLGVHDAVLDDARDIHRVIMLPYRVPSPPPLEEMDEPVPSPPSRPSETASAA